MISFACKDIELSELIRCSFNLNKTDYTVFDFFIKNNKEFSVSEVSKKLKLERSSVQKAIKNLVERNLVQRWQINLMKGGYSFLYSIKDKEKVKEDIITIIDSWHKKVKEAINNWN
ncbi:MAG: helix-turn-helix domain-containing protein [archaeon]